MQNSIDKEDEQWKMTIRFSYTEVNGDPEKNSFGRVMEAKFWMEIQDRMEK